MNKLLKSLVAASAVFAGVAGITGCAEKVQYELALVTDVGDIDDESFNQSAWEAVKEYAEAHSKTYTYYRPTGDNEKARLLSIKQAVKKGAKVVVCPGFLFETALYNCASKYPEVKFILLDGTPNNGNYDAYDSKIEANTACFIYQEEVAGYLAGYAAVAEGKTKLGFCGGMAVPAVQRYGYGFLQGANDAAKAKSVQVTANYYYAGVFQATPEATTTMEGWYAAGTETVFACGGKVYQSVVDGCKRNPNGNWIGVDVDQVNVDPGKVMTSAMKDLKTSVKTALELYDANKWSEIGGGEAAHNCGLNTVLGSSAAKDYVALPTASASWKMTNFTVAQYETLLASIKAGTVTVQSSIPSANPTFSNLTVTWASDIA